MTVSSEQAEKRRRVGALLDRAGLDALVLRSPGNVAWYAGGARTHILMLADVGVAALVVTRDGERLVTPRNEADRLVEEEFAALAPDVTIVDWADDLTAHLPRGDRVGVDVAAPGWRDLSSEVVALRQSLTEPEVDRYRALGRDAALAMTETAQRLSPGLNEHAAAAVLAAGLVARGADPTVLLVAGGDRLPRHRHPLPTGGRLGPLVMMVACARRHGLVANLTRFVSFTPLGQQQHVELHRLLQVEAAFLRATGPGARVGDIYRAGVAAYAEHGFAADEARHHHQGGPTGYAARDYLAGPDSSALVEERQAFAWNPSVPGLKTEDTVLATASGLEVLTVDPAWPTIVVDGRARPDVLVVA